MGTMENTQTLIMRMKTGEDVLCRATKTETGWNLKDPMALVPTPDGRLAFVGWMPFAEGKNGIDLPEDFVLLNLKPIEEIATQYMSFKSGLATPGPKKVVAPEGLKLVGAD
jgi:hypothetical protein